jgi:hypothetical protein
VPGSGRPRPRDLACRARAVGAPRARPAATRGRGAALPGGAQLAQAPAPLGSSSAALLLCGAGKPSSRGAQGLLPALGRLLAASREAGPLLEVLEDVALLGGADLLQSQAAPLAAALAAGLSAVMSALPAPQPGGPGARPLRRPEAAPSLCVGGGVAP